LISIWLIVTGTAFVYAGLYFLNEALFPALVLSSHVSLIFLPSGVRLIGVLLFSHWGALGIVLGSALTSLIAPPELFGPTLVGAWVISGLAPFLAREAGIRFLEMDRQLTRLSGTDLLKLSVVFAAFNSVMHQLWFYWQGTGGNFFIQTWEMAVGDWLGAALLLYAFKFALAAGGRLRRG
jgi:hypothetical protein